MKKWLKTPKILAENPVVKAAVNDTSPSPVSLRQKSKNVSGDEGLRDASLSRIQRKAKSHARKIIVVAQKKKINLTGKMVRVARRGARHLTVGFRMRDPEKLSEALKLAEPVAMATNTKTVIAQRVEGLLVFQFQLRNHLWAEYRLSDLPTPESIGLAESKAKVEFGFGSAPHTLLAGTTGSGKSITISTILLSLIASHKPGDLELIICDRNNDQDGFSNSVYLSAPIAKTDEEIERVLVAANQILAQRIELSIKNGPPLVIVIDEAEKVLASKKPLSIMQQVAAEGRKYNVHALIGCQEPDSKSLPKIFNLLGNRYIGQVANAGVSARLSGHSGIEAHKLTGKGDFLSVSGNSTTRFQVALPYESDFTGLERGEVKPVEIADDTEPLEIPIGDTDSLDIPVLEPPDKVEGRPRLVVDPSHAAYYVFNDPGKITRAIGRTACGLKRDGHDLTKDFALKFALAYGALKEENRRLS